MKNILQLGLVLFFFFQPVLGQDQLDAPDYEKLLQTLETEAQQAYFERHYQTAIRKWKQCITIYEQLGDSMNIAKTKIHLSTIFAQIGEYAPAFAEIKVAEGLFLALNEQYELIHTYKTAARLHYQLANYSEMLSFYKRGLRLAEKLKSTGETVQMLVGMGQTYYLHGDFEQARTFYRRAFKLVSNNGPNWWQARILTYFGILAYYDSQPDSALLNFEKAVAIQKEIEDENGLKDNYVNIGIVYQNKNQLRAAGDAFSKALTLQQKLKDNDGEILTEIKLGDVAYQQLSFPRAQQYYTSALNKSIESGDRGKIAESHKKIGFIHFSQNLTHKADHHLQEALSIARNINDPQIIWRIVHGLGLISEKQNLFTQAFQYYYQALGYIELTNYQKYYASPPTEFTRNETDVFTAAIDVAQKLAVRTDDPQWKERIFEISERKIVRQLNYQLETIAVRTCSTRINLNIQLVRSYSQQHAAILKLLAKEKNKELLKQNIPKIISLQKYLKSIETLRFQLQSEVYLAFPKFRDLFGIHHLTLQELQNALLPEQVLLKYIVLNDQLLILIIQPEQVEIVAVPSDRTQLLADIGNLSLLLKSNSKNESETARLQQNLSRILLEPVQEKIRLSTELIILPDVPLQLFPFEALLWKSKNVPLVHLIEKLPVVYISRANRNFLRSNHYPPIPAALTVVRPDRSSPGNLKEYRKSGWFNVTDRQLPDSANFCQNMQFPPGICQFDFPGYWSEESLNKSVFRAPFNHTNDWNLRDWFRTTFSPQTLLCLPDLTISDREQEMPSVFPEIMRLLGVRCVLFSQQRLDSKTRSRFLQNYYENLTAGNSPAKTLQLVKTRWLQSAEYSAPVYWTNFWLYY